MEEDEGTTTNVEGRVILHRKAVSPPGEAREDWKIFCDLAARLGKADKFNYSSPKDISMSFAWRPRAASPTTHGMTLGTDRREQWRLLAMSR